MSQTGKDIMAAQAVTIEAQKLEIANLKRQLWLTDCEEWDGTLHCDPKQPCKACELRARVARLEAENERLLTDASAEISKLYVERYENGEFTFKADPTLLRMMGHYLLSVLEASNAPNYVSMSVSRVEGRDDGVELIVQRVPGKRPAVVASELKAEVARLRTAVEARDAKRWATNASPKFCLFCEVGTVDGDSCAPDCPTVTHPLEGK